MRNLAPEYRRTGLIAALLFGSMFLPWYTRNEVTRSTKTGELVQTHSTFRAFESFSFVEAAILLVAIAVLALLFVRGQKRPFHLPGGDGAVIAAAGAWVCFLVAYRLIDNKEGTPSDILVSVDYGVTWGIFVTFFIGLLLVHAGLRIRSAHIAEPANPTATMPVRKPPRDRSPLPVEDADWTEDEDTQVVGRAKAVDPLRYDDPY
jgi:hypothetical protein